MSNLGIIVDKIDMLYGGYLNRLLSKLISIKRSKMRTITESLDTITSVYFKVLFNSYGTHDSTGDSWHVEAMFVPHPRQHNSLYPFDTGIKNTKNHVDKPPLFRTRLPRSLGGNISASSAGNDLQDVLDDLTTKVFDAINDRQIYCDKHGIKNFILSNYD